MHAKGDIDVGRRAAQLLLEKEAKAGMTTEAQLERMGLDRKTLYSWSAGHTPSGRALQVLALAGYDVVYILTGRKT